MEITIADTGSAHMADQIRLGELDIALVGLFSDQLPADVTHRLLAVEPLVVLASAAAGPLPANQLSAGRPLGLAEVAEFGALVEMHPESGLRRQVDAAFTRAGVQRSIAFELSTSENVVRFVSLGFGAAMVPRSAVAGRSDLLVCHLQDTEAQHPVSLIHRTPAPSAPSASAFLDLLDRNSR